jgi:sugar phosphate isomerase/epimerase
MKSFRVGIDSYSIAPLELSPFETLEWTKKQGGEGVQFSEVHLKEGQRLEDIGFLKDLARSAKDQELYLEWGGGQHMPYDTTLWKPRDLLPINRRAAKQAEALGAGIIRSCSGGLMRWTDEAPPTEVLLRETARALKAQMPMLSDHGVVLALELHFEFTTFELLRLFEMCGATPGGCLGICLDTMNLLTMLEDPLSGTARILPWVVSTHVKDGGLLTDEKGLVSFTAEAGTGLIDIEGILSLLSSLNRTVHLSIEDHGGTFPLPIFDGLFLSRFPDLTAGELSLLVKTAGEGQRRMEAGTLSPLDRAAWPDRCALRVARGIENVKRIAANLATT